MKILKILTYMFKRLVFPLFIFVDNILIILYRIKGNDTLMKNNFLLEISLGLFIFILTILLGIDKDSHEEITYRKKYIVMMYSIIMLLTVVGKVEYGFYEYIYMFFLILLFTIISSLNIGYQLGTLEKELSYLDILRYSFWSWFFKAKTYIFLYLISLLYLINKFRFLSNISNLSYGSIVVSIISIIIFLLFHLVIDSKDRFGFYSFDYMGEKLKKRDNLNYNTMDQLNNIIQNYGILLYIEDRDYLYRKKPTYSLLKVLSRKLKQKSIVKKFYNFITNKFNKLNQEMISVKSFGDKILVFKNKIIKLYLIIFNNILRGYSTIEQQVIRTTVMKPYTYDYMVRRKLFIEKIYTKFFIKAYKKRSIKNNGLQKRYINILRGKYKVELDKRKKRKDLNKIIKVEILEYYYVVICKNPTEQVVLLKNIESHSSQDFNSLLYKAYKYEESSFKDSIENDFKKYYNYNEGIDEMPSDKYIYDENLKEIKIIKNDNIHILDKLTSKPKLYNDKLAYICPYDFETESNIYIYDFINNIKKIVYKWEADASPKCFLWYDENNICIILGQTYGTVNVGGDLYMLNIESGQLKLIKKFTDEVQITGINMITNSSIKVEGIRYIDENMNESIYYEDIVDI